MNKTGKYRKLDEIFVQNLCKNMIAWLAPHTNNDLAPRASYFPHPSLLLALATQAKENENNSLYLVLS